MDFLKRIPFEVYLSFVFLFVHQWMMTTFGRPTLEQLKGLSPQFPYDAIMVVNVFLAGHMLGRQVSLTSRPPLARGRAIIVSVGAAVLYAFPITLYLAGPFRLFEVMVYWTIVAALAAATYYGVRAMRMRSSAKT